MFGSPAPIYKLRFSTHLAMLLLLSEELRGHVLMQLDPWALLKTYGASSNMVPAHVTATHAAALQRLQPEVRLQPDIPPLHGVPGLRRRSLRKRAHLGQAPTTQHQQETYAASPSPPWKHRAHHDRMQRRRVLGNRHRRAEPFCIHVPKRPTSTSCRGDPPAGQLQLRSLPQVLGYRWRCFPPLPSLRHCRHRLLRRPQLGLKRIDGRSGWPLCAPCAAADLGCFGRRRLRLTAACRCRAAAQVLDETTNAAGSASPARKKQKGALWC